jgi:hypothetical protein
MMIAEEYLSRSRVFRRLKNRSHRQLIERYAARLAEEGLAREGGLRCLSLVGDLMKWIESSGSKVAQVCAGRQREMPVIEVQTSVATHFEAHRRDGASAGGRRLLRYRSVARP